MLSAVWLLPFSVLFFDWVLKLTTFSLFKKKLKMCHITLFAHCLYQSLCLPLCIQIADHPTNPTSWQCNERQRVLLPCFSSYWNYMLSTPTQHNFFASPKSHDSTWPHESQITGHTVCMHVFCRCVRLCEAANEGVWVCMWSYSAVQRCFWPGAAYLPLSSFRPWGPVSCAGLKCAEPAHLQHWLESGPACWNSAACLTARPAPEHNSKITQTRQICDMNLGTALWSSVGYGALVCGVSLCSILELLN